MERQFKVVRVARASGRFPIVEETKELAKVNAEVVEIACTTEDEIIEAVKDADAILCLGTPITRRVMEALPKCKAIVSYGVGFDAIDVDAATDNNILVVNTPAPQWCVEEVSNHAISLLVDCAK